MKIKINQTNENKINDALSAVNGKATSFTITHYIEVERYAATIEKMLEASQLPKAERAGVVARIRPAGPSANAYKYKAKATTITIERGSTGWFLTGVAESEVYPKQNELRHVTITEAQRDTIARKATEGYTIKAKVLETA